MGVQDAAHIFGANQFGEAPLAGERDFAAALAQLRLDILKAERIVDLRLGS